MVTTTNWSSRKVTSLMSLERAWNYLQDYECSICVNKISSFVAWTSNYGYILFLHNIVFSVDSSSLVWAMISILLLLTISMNYQYGFLIITIESSTSMVHQY